MIGIMRHSDSTRISVLFAMEASFDDWTIAAMRFTEERKKSFRLLSSYH